MSRRPWISGEPAKPRDVFWAGTTSPPSPPTAGAKRDTVRAVSAVSVTRVGRLVRIRVEGEGFLYKMVRLMAGAIVRCSLGKLDAVAIQQALAGGQAHRVAEVAPAHGLYLVRVLYARRRIT